MESELDQLEESRNDAELKSTSESESSDQENNDVSGVYEAMFMILFSSLWIISLT